MCPRLDNTNVNKLCVYNQIQNEMSFKVRLKTPITYYGGKQKMLKMIQPNIPPHKRYDEACAGGLALLFAKEKSPHEVVNDTNRFVINFYKVLSTKFDLLKEEIAATIHSRALYEDARVIMDNPHLFDDVQHAWAFWVGTQMGFSHQLGSWAVDKSKNSTAKNLSNKIIALNEEIAKRLQSVQFECKDMNDVIRMYDSPETFHYVDPPYFNSDCGHYGGYTKEAFRALLTTLSNVEGKFLLSSYPSDILKEFKDDNGWKQKRITKTVGVTHRTKKNKVECLTANYMLK